MTYIIFENDGEIDPVAIKTFGVSAKDGERPIGFFGTGLKYAAAIVLRLGGKIAIQSGTRTMLFGTRRVDVRGKSFDLVTLAGDDLGFTTDVGKRWEPWMAYRELRCNAVDEGGSWRVTEEWPRASAGKTRVVVKCDELISAHACSDMYFIERRQKIDEGLLLDVHEGSSTTWFYRGVNVGRMNRPSVLTYNLKTGVDLTEDRTAKYSWIVASFAARYLLMQAPRDVLLRTLVAKDMTFEGSLDFKDVGDEPSSAFIEAVGELMTDKLARINPSALVLYKKATLSRVNVGDVALTPAQEKMLARATAFVERFGWRVGEYPIVVAESLGEGILGLALDERIYLALRVFDQGTKQVAATLIEEYVHLKHKYFDMTRELQTYLFDRLVTMGEEMTGEPL